MRTLLLSDALDLSQFERVIVLSPHLDDAALSCGALLAGLRGTTQGLVITIASADAQRPRKGFASSATRRREDERAMGSIGCHYIHLGFADAVYRRNPATDALVYLHPRRKWQAPPQADATHIEELWLVLRRLVVGLGRVLLVAPMGIGFHVDHMICARVATRLAQDKVKLLFYEDFPYVASATVGGGEDHPTHALGRLGLTPVERYAVPVDVDEKARLILAYTTQIAPLFGDEAGVRRALEQQRHRDRAVEFYWRAER